MALVTMATIMPRLSVPTVIIPIIPMIARLTAFTDQTGSQAASLLEPGRGFMATGEATGAEGITGAVGIMDAVSTADAVASTADVVASAADAAASAADAAASAADAAASTAVAVASAADAAASAADEAAAVDSTEVVEAGSTAAAVAVPMAVGMVGATDN